MISIDNLEASTNAKLHLGPSVFTSQPNKVIVLDRDGVLNKMIVHQEHGIIDSPMVPEQVELQERSAEALNLLRGLGYLLVIATNQPAAKKGKTTFENLSAVHCRIVEALRSEGGHIDQSYISPYLREDHHPYRKPGTGMLEQAFHDFPSLQREDSWMIGDGATDILCGKRFGLKTAFIGPRKTDIIRVVHETAGSPDLWCDSLIDFAEQMIKAEL